MREQLFLFCLLLFDVEAKGANEESGSIEGICESGTGETLPVIFNTRTNSSIILEADNAIDFDQIGLGYTGSEARQGHSVMARSQLLDSLTEKLRKVISSLSQVKAVLLQMLSNIEEIFSRLVLANPFLAAVHMLGKQMLTIVWRLGELLVLKSGLVMYQARKDINLLRNNMVKDFDKAVTWVNQWWQALHSVVKSWLPSSSRQEYLKICAGENTCKYLPSN